MEQKPIKKSIKIRGYLYVLIEKFTLPDAQKQVSCTLSLGNNANCETKSYVSGAAVNEVFLIEVPEDPSRLAADFKMEGKSLGECRYDISPFFTHLGNAHSITSQIMDIDQKVKGTVSMKITYYSAQFGKLKVRVFYLSLVQPVVDVFAKARLKLKIGVFAQSSSLWETKNNFDQTMELLVLSKNANLQFDVVHEEGILAKYTIYDLQKSGLLIDQTKAYQVSLFNKDKAVGTIKYQIDWIH